VSAPRSLASARALAEAMLGAALGAAEIVNRIYHEADRGVTFKVGDDPVTRADHEANAFLLDALGPAERAALDALLDKLLVRARQLARQG